MKFDEIKNAIKDLKIKIEKFPIYKGNNIRRIDSYRENLLKEYNEINEEITGMTNDEIKNLENIDYITQVMSLKFCELEIEKKWLEESQWRTDRQVEKLQDRYNEIDNLKNNLFNFFGLIVGLLAFIFVNYQFISSAKDLGIGKMLMFLGIANIGLILGIFLILGILGDLLGQPEKLKNSLKVMRSGWLFLGIIAIIVIGFSLDLFDRSENYKNIDVKINEVQERVERHNADLYNELNKRDIEIGRLQNEIDSLKNKK